MGGAEGEGKRALVGEEENLKEGTGMGFWEAEVTCVERRCGSYPGQSWEQWPGSDDL